jgi:hypothetical protein
MPGGRGAGLQQQAANDKRQPHERRGRGGTATAAEDAGEDHDNSSKRKMHFESRGRRLAPMTSRRVVQQSSASSAAVALPSASSAFMRLQFVVAACCCSRSGRPPHSIQQPLGRAPRTVGGLGSKPDLRIDSSGRPELRAPGPYCFDGAGEGSRRLRCVGCGVRDPATEAASTPVSHAVPASPKLFGPVLGALTSTESIR